MEFWIAISRDYPINIVGAYEVVVWANDRHPGFIINPDYHLATTMISKRD